MKVELSSTLQGLSGLHGDIVFRRLKGQTIIAQRPERKERPPTAAQAAHRARFRSAVNYAATILEDRCQRLVYEGLARQTGRRADKILTSDFLTPPVVELIDIEDYGGRVGDVIRVMATDDVEVVSVQVSIHTGSGEVLEQGAAIKQQGVWRYTATVAAPESGKLAVIAVATDRPGHEGRGAVECG